MAFEAPYAAIGAGAFSIAPILPACEPNTTNFGCEDFFRSGRVALNRNRGPIEGSSQPCLHTIRSTRRCVEHYLDYLLSRYSALVRW